MNNIILKTQNITKRYGSVNAVDNISMNIHKGDIYGLIGRNGAGKTTLTRLITSLIVGDSGTIELYGENTERGLMESRNRIGCVIEQPAFYPNLSAHRNLEYYRILKGITDKSTVNKALSLAGLTNTGKKRYKDFSLGMKQRLGLALSLLSNPDFIILDEPINGLDPMGIVEMREILTRLNHEHNITILISSHILTELSLIATRYGIIENGKLIRELTREQLNDACKQSVSIIVDNTKLAVTILETQLKTKNYKVIDDKEIRIYDYLDDPSEINYVLNNNGVRVMKIALVGENLEDYFINLVDTKSSLKPL